MKLTRYITLIVLSTWLAGCTTGQLSSPNNMNPYIKNQIPANSSISAVFTIDDNFSVHEGLKFNDHVPVKTPSVLPSSLRSRPVLAGQG